MPDGIDTLVQKVQSADCEPMLNGALPHSCLKQLSPGDHSVLPSCQRRNRGI